MNTVQRRTSNSNFWLRYGHVNFYIIIIYIYTAVYMFIYLLFIYLAATVPLAACALPEMLVM